MNGWGWAALSVSLFAASLFLARAVGRLFVVDPYPQDLAEMDRFEALRSALGDGR